LTAKESPSRKQIQACKLWEKAIKYLIAFCVATDVGGKETYDVILNMKYSIHAVKFRWPPYLSVILLARTLRTSAIDHDLDSALLVQYIRDLRRL